ncbi:alpha-amylase family protein [Brevundimonas subvibrioides]|uniref:Alpha amylase catalytic region n=1 Tax=Brevundimonas subvibrioides (strain ATCC 15264 / DSM 4735 / LMG 14903 / NBRC 16000 / CB 81) TaxID=633149 RepID=D9QH23_BRESC|nr:alpha-amylase family protein [Brevundimonas subvibrioides]ADL00989.1 alpha amylase catalytic region [Brevundimonas subvibrioides ATCC 15264]
MTQMAETPADRPTPESDRRWQVLRARFRKVYGDHPACNDVLSGLEASLSQHLAARRPDLKALDAAVEAHPGARSASGQSIYTFYVDRFDADLSGLAARADYLKALGVKWLHPLPLLRPRPGDSDGGFAVQDYREIDPRLGDMDQMEALATELQRHGIGVILDVVCNHTAREHAWAVVARAGYSRYRDYYITVENPDDVARWEEDLIDVFPDTAPGSFTPDAEMGGHVWTTFYPFQWDLNYANPAVFAEMLEVLLYLASKGVQGFRLDSAPFLWKRPGTTCRNQAEVYWIVEAWRAALSIVAPSVVLIAEAIEGLEDVLPFFGQESPGCDLAYSNGVMTALWGALADGDAGIAAKLIAAASARPDGANWLNYVRCHDDLIWNALADYAPPEDLARWSRFYGGGGANSFSNGRAFQTAEGGVPSTNGMAASLAGLEDDPSPTGLPARRLILLYATIYGLDGWPLIYMGDEIGLTNDQAFAEDPLRAVDGRWLHRPLMDWTRAGLRDQPGTVEQMLFDTLSHLGATARRLNDLGVSGRAIPCAAGDPAVLAFTRDEGTRRFLLLANMSDRIVSVTVPHGYSGAQDVLGLADNDDMARLAPYAVRWLVTG